MAYAILRTEKIKTVEKLKAVAGHHARTRLVKNADRNRSGKNIHLIDCDRGLVESVEQRIGGRKIRKNGVLAIEVLITASPEYFRDDPSAYGSYDPEKTTAFNDRALSFLTAEFGADNLVSAICHLDEATPHIHAVIVPIDPDTNKLNASRWLDGRAKLSALQDRYFEEMKPLGLERGLKGSEAEHTTIQQYYYALENAEKLAVSSPVVAAPPLLINSTNRQEWADSESERIQQMQTPIYAKIEAQSAVSAINLKKAKQAEKTAKKLAVELDQAKAIANKSKDIDLQRLLMQMRANRIDQDGQFLVNGQSILVKGQTFADARQQISGVGSIDLLMHVERFDYQEALQWIRQQFSQGCVF